ncbi:MAG: GGDEF domain-containing protein [Oceanospirillaceae bacterium]|nr:GGDEF domain-containing protein [Oceanospirillaceae bacterium]
MVKRKDWSERNELQTLQILSEEAAKLIESSQRSLRLERDNFQHESLHDPLTGLQNRRGLEKAFQARFALGIEPVCCAIFDLDHFKKVNDTYGHDFGDRVLKEFALIASEHMWEGCTLSRTGGEEFVVIGPFPKNQSPGDIFESLLTAVEQRLHQRVDIPQAITVSCGYFLSLPETEYLMGSFMRLADLALYDAKVSRNSVVGLRQVLDDLELSDGSSLQDLIESGALTRSISNSQLSCF